MSVSWAMNFPWKMMVNEHTHHETLPQNLCSMFFMALEKPVLTKCKISWFMKNVSCPMKLNCCFSSYNTFCIYCHEFTFKIMFGNLYMEKRGLKISFLHNKSIMKDIIIITKKAVAAECYRHIHDFVSKKTFKWAGENSDIILHWLRMPVCVINTSFEKYLVQLIFFNLFIYFMESRTTV